ncbi:leucine zipper protein 2 [Pelodytes ibericus]
MAIASSVCVRTVGLYQTVAISIRHKRTERPERPNVPPPPTGGTHNMMSLIQQTIPVNVLCAGEAGIVASVVDGENLLANDLMRFSGPSLIVTWTCFLAHISAFKTIDIATEPPKNSPEDLVLLPAVVMSTRQGYEDLEKQLKDVFNERSSILRQLSKTSRELEGIKGNIQFLKNNEASSISDMQKLLDLEEKQRNEMKSLQEAFAKQLNEATEKAEKQQATINFLKTEMERKSKMIRDLQNENKSLKNKLMSGNKLCGLRAEESKRIQAQLKELRYGKKDLVSKAQILTDLEQKLTVAKEEMEKASLDKESQLKALKETVQLCLSSVLHNQPPTRNIIPSKTRDRPTSSGVPFQTPNSQSSVSADASSRSSELTMKGFQHLKNCDSQNAGETCRLHPSNSTLINKIVDLEPNIQQLHGPPWIKPEDKEVTNRQRSTDGVNMTARESL